MARENLLARTFVTLADSLTGDSGVSDFLTLLCERCTDLFAVTATGVVVVDDQQVLRLVSASSEDVRVLEVFEMQSKEGPCQDAYRTGDQVVANDLEACTGRWPAFVPFALQEGFCAAYAFPLRLRGKRIGALNMFRDQPGPFDETDVVAAQALADFATIGLLQEREVRGLKDRAAQLQHALDSRVVIEQAKGVVHSALHTGDMGLAFEAIRRYSRNHNQPLRSVCRELVEGRLPATALDPGRD